MVMVMHKILALLFFMLSMVHAVALIQPNNDHLLSFNPKALEASKFDIILEQKHYTIEITKTIHQLGTTLYEGYVVGDNFSYFNIAQASSYVGILSIEGKNYSIQSSDALLATVTPKDAMPKDILLPGKSLTLPSNTQANKFDDRGDFIDILIVYIKQVSVNIDLNSTVSSYLGYANNALARSCAKFRYRIVGVKKLDNYFDSNGTIPDHLENLKNGTLSTSDGNLTTVRNNLGADLVQLWASEDNDYCGLAYVNANSNANSKYGFSAIVVNKTCSIATFAHELGHNMGASHDRYEQHIAEDDFSYYEGYGFVDLVHNVHSIMAYSDECLQVSGKRCTLVPYFSNPNLIRDGVVFGKAGSADTVSVMNQNRFNVASFRAAKSDYTPDLSGCSDVSSQEGAVTNCFVATAAYGSYLEKDVVFLRHFRDKVLLKTQWGSDFVTWYYKNSPHYANIIANNPTLKSIVRAILSGVVFSIKHVYAIFFVVLLLILFQIQRRVRA